MPGDGSPVTYDDLRVGDVIEVRIDAPMFPQIDGDWERREVVDVFASSADESEDRLVVRFRDPSDGREYDINARSAKEARRRMRRALLPLPTSVEALVDQSQGLRDEAVKLIAQRRYGDAAGFLRRSSVKLELAEERLREAALSPANGEPR